jgi:hypothetical protein
MAEVLKTVVTLPPGKGHSKRSKLYYDMSKRVCWKYISYCKGNQDYCSVAQDFSKNVSLTSLLASAPKLSSL